MGGGGGGVGEEVAYTLHITHYFPCWFDFIAVIAEIFPQDIRKWSADLRKCEIKVCDPQNWWQSCPWIKGMRTASSIVSLNYVSLSQLINDKILTSFCSISWGDRGGVITCSLHTSAVIPSSSGGGNGTLARGGTSTASCVKEERQTNSELNWRATHPNFNNAVSKTNFQNQI